MVVAGIKAVFGLLAAAMYVYTAKTMVDGATGTVGYVPNDGTSWVVAVTAAALISFVSAQIGVTVAAPADGSRNLQHRVRASMFGTDDPTPPDTQDRASWIALGVLILDTLVLVIMGALFFRLYIQPEHIAVAKGTKTLTDAPEYIATQAKAIIGLVLAGAGGIAVGAAGSRR